MSMDIPTHDLPHERRSSLAALSIWCFWYLALAGCASMPRAGHEHQASSAGSPFRVYVMKHAYAQFVETCEDVDSSLPRTEKRCWYRYHDKTDNGPLASRQPYAHGKPHGTGKSWYEDGTLKSRITYAHGVHHGPWEHWNADGTLVERRFHVQGIPHGEWASWDAEGRPDWVLHYDMGRPVGEWAYWSYTSDDTVQWHVTCAYGGAGQERSVTCRTYDQGRLSEVQLYQDLRPWDGPDYPPANVSTLRDKLVRNGTRREYDQEGHETEESVYVDGALHGPFHRWYGPDRPEKLGAYVNGREHGAWRAWHEGGVLAAQVTWEYGQKHGPFARWYEDGKPAERGVYQHGKKHGRWERRREDGSLVSRGSYEQDVIVGEWEEHDEDGSVHRGAYRDGKRQGTWTTSDANGTLRVAGQYAAGKQHGLWVEWSSSGQKIMERRYDEHGRLRGAYVEWHEGGGIALRGQYGPGGKQGLWERFDPVDAVPGATPAANDAKGAIAPGVYFDNELFQPVGYQLHGGCGAVFPAEREAGGQCGLSVVRSHRRPSSPAFWGYGLELAGERFGDSTRFILGPALRVGLMTRSRRRGRSIAKGTYVYTQATPLLSSHQDALSGGVRLSVGYSSPAFIGFVWEGALDDSSSSGHSDKKLAVVFLWPALLAINLLSHGEFVYQYERERGRSLGFMFGFGF